jgi:hypothetical protein
MVSVQRSIEIRVPVHTLYSQLTQFEDYPQFMQDIESVEQRDDTHLHWKARLMDKPIEWDAVITECVPDQYIAWQSENGPGNAGKVELQPVGPAASRLTLTLVSEIDFEPMTPAGDIKAEFSERIWEDLTRLRSMVESKGQLQSEQKGAGRGAAGMAHGAGQPGAQEAGPVADLGIAQGRGQAGNSAGREGIDEVARLGSVEGTAEGTMQGTAQGSSGGVPYKTDPRHAVETVQRDRGSPGNPVPASGFAAGSEGFSGDEDPSAPVTSALRKDAPNKEFSGSSTGSSEMHVSELNRSEKSTSTQSDYSLSQGRGDEMQDERDSIAEEVNFDQQSDATRHVGNLPGDDANDGANVGLPNAEVIAKTAQRRRPEPEF